MIRLAIIIINYQTFDFIRDCLCSLDGQLQPNDRVIIVDNASGDDSAAGIRNFICQQDWVDWAVVVESPVNGGFSAGNNIGIQEIEAQYYLLLNSDTIVRPKAIEYLLHAADMNSDAGLFAPRLEWLDSKPQNSCFRMKTPMHEFFAAARTGIIERMLGYKGIAYSASEEPVKPTWVSFACVLIRRDVFDAIGLLDEGFFMYYDDLDFCLRARRAGFQILYWPQSRVVHMRGGSSPVKQLTAERKRPPKYWYASRTRYYAKFYGIFGLFAANFGWYGGRILSLFRELSGTKDPHICHNQWADIWTNVHSPLKSPDLQKINWKDD
jgi:GT2 family glycosyltransferase